MIDQIRLNFNATGITIINAAIGLMMLGVALELKIDDFMRIVRSPKAPLIGLMAQFILLPAFTFLLVLIIKPHPSIALGMMLVAACPGGNLSNLLTYLSNGNSALSISMTAVSTVVAIFMTPFNLSLLGQPESGHGGHFNPGPPESCRCVCHGISDPGDSPHDWDDRWPLPA